MSKIIYAQAVATRNDRIWCDNCGEDLTFLKSRLVDPRDHLTITNVGGITHLTDEANVSLHRCQQR